MWSKLASEKHLKILMPVHSTLVKPTLTPGQVLNGVMVHRIFKEKRINTMFAVPVLRDLKGPTVTTPEDFDILSIHRTFDGT